MGEVIAHLRAHRPQLGPSQIVGGPVSSIDELMRQIASVDTVVASRFHNVLCAFKLAKPTLSVGYAAKFGVLMERSVWPSSVNPPARWMLTD
jgi:polysaccharide pyruvyl transferase WcaK-like protein